MTELLYSSQARRALAANLSPRYRRLERLERYVNGTIYDGRPSFWDDDYPLHDRAPLVVYPIVASAIRSNVDLCLGEGRWPTLTSFVDEDDSEFAEDVGLNEEDSEKLDRAVQVICDQARLKAAARELLVAAQSCGTAVAICSVRNGRLSIDTTRACWSTPEFDPARPDVVARLEIKYPYLEEYFDLTAKKWAQRCMIYRRVIDETSDTTYQPIEADIDGTDVKEESWRQDKTKSVDHNLGFCPVVWYPFSRDCSTVAEFDGKAIHCHLTDEIDALNYGLSQRHVAAMVASSPPTIEIGVDEDHNPCPTGRRAEYPLYLVDSQGNPLDPPEGRAWVSGGGGYAAPSRKRGPSQIWRYPSAESRVEMLTLSGDALKPIDDNCRDLRAKIAEALAVVFSDIENARSTVDVSGRALREQHRRQIERCDIIRDDFGANCLLKIIDILMRLCLRVDASRLRVPGLDKFLPLLGRFEQEIALDAGGTAQEWLPPTLRILWPDYFQPSESDQKAVIDGTIALLNAGLITKRTAVERVKEFYAIQNVDEYVDSLEEEAEAVAESELTQEVAKADQMGQVQVKTAKAMPPKPNGAAPKGLPQ